MGIAGLLPQLKSITKRVHLSSYDGRTVAIDTYCLLHKGAHACARELVEGEPTTKHIAYCLSRIELLLKNGVTPLCIFDGGPLPNKADEERQRARLRQDNRDRARDLWRQGNRTAAVECYQKAVDITPTIAQQLVQVRLTPALHAIYHCTATQPLCTLAPAQKPRRIVVHLPLQALQERGIAFIVAPFEADAQCAYLALTGAVHAVLTEDSDLLTYGCPKVLFKVDWNGDADEVSLADLPNCRELSFTGWSLDLFQQMCVMAGCDFVNSLPGIGIKKAHANIRRTKDFRKALRALRFDGVQVPTDYEIKFQRALWTFRHQRVYCPERKAVVHLTDLPGGSLAAHAAVPAAAELAEGEIDFLGPPLADDVAQGIAEGRLHPITHQPFMRENFADAVGTWVHRGTDSARQGFKRPRVAPEKPPAMQPAAQVQAKAKSRAPLRAVATANKYFGQGNGEEQDPKLMGHDSMLRASLQAALRSCRTSDLDPQAGAKQDSTASASAGDADELEDIDGTLRNADAAGNEPQAWLKPNNLLLEGGRAELLDGDALAPMWRPRVCLSIAAQVPLGSMGPVGGADKDTSPWGNDLPHGVAATPGFYAAAATAAVKTSGQRAGVAASGPEASPRLLNFNDTPNAQRNAPGHGDAEGEVDDGNCSDGERPRELQVLNDLVDLRHIPAVVEAAVAAVDAAERRAEEGVAMWQREEVGGSAPGDIERQQGGEVARPYLELRCQPDAGASLPFARFAFKK